MYDAEYDILAVCLREVVPVMQLFVLLWCVYV